MTMLYASFDDSSAAERAAGALLDYGASPDDLSLVWNDPASSKSPPSDPGELRFPDAWGGDVDLENRAKSGITVTTPVDAEAGAVRGAGVGVGVGAVAALVSLFIPGVGLVAGGGALAVAIAGLVGSTGAGAIAGAVTGYLKDQGMDWLMAEHFTGTVSQGGALLSIAVPSREVDEATARSIFNKYGAANVTNVAKAGAGYLA